ncbi:MAG: beta-glucoside transporter subunit [Bacillales bacterium]|jgi:PTS system beta-glucosides-specific IIC component|nr:beta-glucoside transporter subunit [Bacillales bacterium]
MGFFKKNKMVICSPMEGELVPLVNVNDPVFAGEMLGKGVAIIPSVGKAVSPISGKILTVFETKHAIGLVDDNGIEVLIHIGLNTVELKGEFYKTHVKAEDLVKVGDLLVEFDLQAIKDAGYDVITPVVITNTNDFSEISGLKSGLVHLKDEILKIVK